MMTDIALVFPDQLFEQHPAMAPGRPVCLAEEFLFYKVQPFHKQRLVLLRAAMAAYAARLRKERRELVYIPSKDLDRRGALFAILAKRGIKTIHLAEFSDAWLREDLMAAAQKYGWALRFYPSPAYVCSEGDVKAFFSGKQRFSMAQFYAYQRKRLGILMDGQTPCGGKYSFDTENRRKVPKGLFIPPPYTPLEDQHVEHAIAEIEGEFPEAVGEVTPFLYPTTHEGAEAALEDFLRHKLQLFGDYQDAILAEQSVLFHSVLSPLLNIGLLTPQKVIRAVLAYARENPIPMNSLEGFIRQVIGWREYVRAVYEMQGSLQRSSNFFGHHQGLPDSFWKGTTGILPIDACIRRALQTGYCHHIERLMVLGNFMLLTETSPHEVYKWFMAFFVDAYDWVMVPNVYGMSQYADGGMIVTKPYVGASNYLLKMSNYSKGPWTEIWDGLFWRFLRIHHTLFQSNPRTGALIMMLHKNESSIYPKIQKVDLWLRAYRKG